MKTTRRRFVGGALLAGTGAKVGGNFASAQNSPVNSGSSLRRKIQALDYQGVRLLNGPLLDQYTRTRNFYWELSDDDILKGFRKLAGLPASGSDMGGWAEHDTSTTFGQWLSGMARMYKATGDTPMRDKALHLMTEWGKTIRPGQCPYYAYDNKPAQSHYPFEKTVYGLVDIHRYIGDTHALELLDRLTEWGMKNLDRARLPATPTDPSGPPAHGIEWYTLPENLYNAYVLTGESKYKSFGDLWLYPQYWNRFKNLETIDIHGLHAYSHVNTLSSAAMAYAVSGDEQYLEILHNAYDYFQQTQTYATGGYGPAEHLMSADGSLGRSLETQANTFETPCGSWAVFKLGRYLTEFTAEARYGDWIEALVYNGIGAALPMADRTNPFFDDIWSINGWNGGVPVATRGRTFYYADYRMSAARKDYFYANWPCCSGTYIQDVADYHNLIYYRGEQSIYVNLYVPSELSVPIKGQEIRLVQETRYPESENSTLTVRTATPGPVEVCFRVPSWSKGMTITVNDRPAEVRVEPGSWATVRREWQAGDKIKVRIPMSIRTVPVDRQHPNRVAFVYGPVVLVSIQDEKMASNGNPSKELSATGKPLEFAARFNWQQRLIPFYRAKALAPYSIYFDLA